MVELSNHLTRKDFELKEHCTSAPKDEETSLRLVQTAPNLRDDLGLVHNANLRKHHEGQQASSEPKYSIQ
jgi:hypothetical protein